MSDRHAVVVGGLGVIGRALIDHLTGDPGWDVVALSRRAPDFETTAPFCRSTCAKRTAPQLRSHNSRRLRMSFMRPISPCRLALWRSTRISPSLSTLWRR